MKPLMKTILASLFAICFTATANSQDQAAEAPVKPLPACESKKGFSDFDFWLGEWNVYSNDDKRQLQGTNSISKSHKSCLIMENWTSVQGGTGSSMNYYDPVEDRWRQLWVAGGYSIDYTGGLDENGSMVLTGKINYYNTGKSHAFRGKWTPNGDGSVRQLFEQQDTETKEWSVWFDGLYIRQGRE